MLDAPIKKKFLKFTDELAEELYKPVTRKCQRRRVNVNGIDEILAADLIDMQAFSKDNNEIKYLITVTVTRLNLLWHGKAESMRKFKKMEKFASFLSNLSMISTSRNYI